MSSTFLICKISLLFFDFRSGIFRMRKFRWETKQNFRSVKLRCLLHSWDVDGLFM